MPIPFTHCHYNSKMFNYMGASEEMVEEGVKK